MKVKLSSKKVIIIGIIFLFLGLFFIESKTNILTTALRGNDPTAEIRKVTIESSNYPEAGSWSIDKSAKWIGANRARVTFDVSTEKKIIEGNYKDIILIMDISGSMAGEKLDKAKTDAIELSNYLLSDSHNRVALISFESTSTVVSGFTNNLTTITDSINGLTETGCTNYNAGLLNVFEVMEGYEKKEDTDLITLFLTDGYPNEDTPNQKGTYRALKEKYPYMTINGIQYEMGSAIIQDIVDITDNQWIASMDTLNNVLFEATVSPMTYESFIVEDYIDSDYYTLDSIDDIKVSIGTISLDNSGLNQKVIWTIENSLVTGGNATMTIDLSLKNAYHEVGGLYPTNESETIKTKLPDEEEITTNSDKTPVLKNAYNISYDSNSPDTNCTLPTYQDETYFIYQTVEKKDTELTCDGYLFKGWEIAEIDDDDITHLNDDYFLMPEHDITIRGTWTSLGISKTMDGTVHVKTTLYKVLEDAASVGTYAKEYVGSHQDSMNVSLSTKKIYYWYADNDTNGTAILDKNNVIFGGFCWQILRTTDTGGVKLIYNGEPDQGKCLNTRSNHKGTVGTNGTTKNLNGAYLYGDTYEYDTTNNTFTLVGNLTTMTWSDSTYRNLLGKYTCASGSSTCSTIYQVNGYQNSTTAYTTRYTVGDTHYSQIGTTPFNANFRSPAMVGYMYNDVYNYNSKNMTSIKTILSSSSLGTNYWYANSIIWGSPTANKYNLDSPYQVSSTTDYSNLVGEYTFRNATQTYTNTSVYYIAAVNNTTMYYIQLGNETGSTHDLSYYNHTYTYGDSYIDNGNGTYTINNPTTIHRSDWYTSYKNVKSKYVCKNAVNNTCSELWYTTVTTATNMTYITSTNTYKYAKSFTWDGSKYILDNATSVSFWNIADSTNKTSLNNAHYTCWNETGECTTISYIYYISGTTPYYINIEGGKSVEDALTEMLSSNGVNSINSTIKGNIEAWYEKYMLPYESYLEDIIYCNDRSISALNGWNPDGGSVTEVLQFKEYNATTDLSCTNITDRFSVSNTSAPLTYKVGLISNPEMNLLNNSKIITTGQIYWLASPNDFDLYVAHVRIVNSSGTIGRNLVYDVFGVRPAVSLISSTEYTSGDGSMANPFVVE